MNGTLVDINKLPSRGRSYPKDIQIYVTPCNVKQLIEMDKFGVTTSEYYQNVLEGVTLQNAGFPKEKLLYPDIQYIDLIRRLYTFDRNQEIKMSGLSCWGVAEKDCTNEEIDFSFRVDSIKFEELSDEVFEDIPIGEPDKVTGEVPTIKGKIYEFTDGLKVVVAPLTTKEFMDMTIKYVVNNNKPTESTLYIAYRSYAIKHVFGKEYKDRKAMQEDMYEYIENICNNKDIEMLKDMENCTLSLVEPIKTKCPVCGRDLEVRVTPSASFHQ